jgi:hypothetical protein
MEREHGKREGEVIEQIDLNAVSIKLGGGTVHAVDPSGNVGHRMNVYASAPIRPRDA